MTVHGIWEAESAAGSRAWLTSATALVAAAGFAGADAGMRAELRAQWLRTRPVHQGEAAMHDTEAVDAGSTALVGVGAGRAQLEALQAFADAVDAGAAHVWEVDRVSAHVRRARLRLGSDGLVVSHDPGADADPPRIGSAAPDGAPAPGGDPLRARRLDELAGPLESAGLVNGLAARLGGEPNPEIGWPTLAPASGSSPAWNGSLVRRLTWSGHAESFRTSRIAALVEGIERLVGGLQLEGTVTVAPGAGLPGRVLTPDDFDAYPEAFFRHGGSRYDPAEPHEWVRARSLVTGEPVWVPRELVHYGAPVARSRWGLGTSSGCATGSTTGEAALFGLLELIERDAFVNSWYGRVPAIPIDPGARFAPLRRRVGLLGWKPELGLLRTPLGLPVFVACVDTGAIRSIGAACHPVPAVAAERALAEAVSYAPDREQAIRAEPERAAALLADPALVHGIDDHPLLAAAGGPADYAELAGTGRAVAFEEAVRAHVDESWGADAVSGADAVRARLVGALAARGVETFARVQTAAFERELGLETVAVIAPGLSQLDFGWGNQRAAASTAPARFARELLGFEPEPRRLPHPFS
ncbi:YcaO-like family protein [Agromyces archimandritae]|uniref:YcaO-like family protein n=1 Tax=Agromyces archimandritae TaxID=2781962 RepID=A0A975FLR8_9MICO|nr:YcaO-like family protein [Agromyces archimandritae]QTX04067.1 YcaO-like family protein [Agromyces archimandritae]